MKINKSFLFLLFLVGWISTLQGQSTERFIRVVGNSSTTFEANKAKLAFTITAIKQNSYEKKAKRSVEMIYEEWLAQLEPLGFKDADLKRDFSNFSSMRNQDIDKYTLVIDLEKDFETIADIEIEGLRLTNTIFIFDQPGASIEDQLAIDAIEDATRKADALCKRLGKKRGKILNIEDVSSGCCRSIPEGKKEQVEKTYKVNVTFELID
jgi:uncharacterized protein YggE